MSIRSASLSSISFPSSVSSPKPADIIIKAFVPLRKRVSTVSIAKRAAIAIIAKSQ